MSGPAGHRMPDLLLGLDIGTASSKGVLVRPGGEMEATAVRPHTTSYPRAGWAEHDAEAIWWSDVASICRELTASAAERGGRIQAMCISGIGPCVLPVDEKGTPLRPAILYGIDTRATSEIEELAARHGRAAIVARSGSALTTQSVGPKVLWLRRNEPGVWGRTARLHMASSFAVERLTGEYVLDHHSASQCGPLYDLVEQRWAQDWAAEITGGLALPRLAWPAEVVGRVTPAAAAVTGVPAGTPVTAGTIDAWAEAVSVGVRAPGDLMLMYGSTMFLVLVTATSLRDERLWSTAGAFRDTYTLAGGLATSGALTAWFSQIAGNAPFETLLAEAREVPRGSAGLVVLPYFAGERTPLHDPLARGVVAGLTLRHGRGHVYRALLEGTAYGVRHNLEVFEAAGARPQRMFAVGGGTADDLWMQIVSDVTGRSQIVPRVTIGAAYGDAYLAGLGVGALPIDREWNEAARTIDPGEGAARAYDPLYRAYRELYPATLAQVHALAQMQVG